MGHWEQIGRDNAEARARRAALPLWRRVAADYGRAALVVAAWIGLFAVLLAPLWKSKFCATERTTLCATMRR